MHEHVYSICSCMLTYFLFNYIIIPVYFLDSDYTWEIAVALPLGDTIAFFQFVSKDPVPTCNNRVMRSHNYN